MELYHADILIDHRHILAEGPVWDSASSTLQYVDISGCALHTFDPATGKRTTLDLTQNIGCFALREGGGYIMGLAAGVYLWGAAPNDVRKLPQPDFPPIVRSNDGKCDPTGRFWCGTADHIKGTQAGELYCILPDGRSYRMLEGLGCSNGLAFAGNKVYFIDSPRRQVEEYTLDEATMTLKDMRVVVQLSPEHCSPDGMTMDTEGMLWVAHWGAGFVGRYNPLTGELLAKVTITASQCSSCCFGGSDMQTLFITSASVNKQHEPDAGKVFSVRLPYKGVPSYKFPG